MLAARGELVDWLKGAETQQALLVVEEADPRVVATVTGEGYATDLDETEMVAVGLDPFPAAPPGGAAPESNGLATFRGGAVFSIAWRRGDIERENAISIKMNKSFEPGRQVCCFPRRTFATYFRDAIHDLCQGNGRQVRTG